ncbi:hypothetical protein Tco_0969005 [Tanacetum coccineum]
MQQFWYTIKKVKDSESYEFLLANKKCIVDVEVFRKIMDIFPRVEGEEFTEVQDDDATLTFLTDLGYKSPLHKYTNMYVDHMHQPWRTLAAIINKFLSKKTKRKGKGSQGKKTVDTPVADVDVSEEPDSEPSRKKTDSRRVVKKKVTISTADNIIPDLDVALELGKSISLIEAAEEEAAWQVHATHARIVTESEPEPAKKKTEQESTDIMQALKESKKTSRRQPGTKGSSEGTGVSPGVPDESTVIPATSMTEEDQGGDEEVDLIDFDEDEEKKDDDDDDKSIDLEKIDDEETDDEFVHSGEYVHTDDKETDDEFVQGDEQANEDEDEEMTNVKVEDSGKGDAEISDVAKANAKKIKEIKDDAKKAELPPTSSNLSVSLGFGDQFLKISSDTSLLGNIKDTIDPLVLTPIPETPSVAPTTTLLPRSFVSTIPPIPHQTIAPITTNAPSITTTVPESNALIDVQLRVEKLEKDVSKLKKIDHSTKALATLKLQVLTVVEHYLGSKISDDLQKIQKPTVDPEQESKKTASEIHKVKKELAEKQKMLKYSIKSTNKAALKEYD